MGLPDKRPKSYDFGQAKLTKIECVESTTLRSQERWVFWAGCIATREDEMITASDALNSFREKIRVV
jgi:hypothetical protein